MITPKALGLLLVAGVLGASLPAAETVSTAVYSRVSKDYRREPLPGSGFKPEYYALSNGGKISGTTSDSTVDRVPYPEIANIAMRLLEKQGYHYARNKGQAQLLIVLQWGNTIVPNQTNYQQTVNRVATAMARVNAAKGPQGMGSLNGFSGRGAPMLENPNAGDLDSEMQLLAMENRARDRVNEFNARVLGYLDEINESNTIARWAGRGDVYTDLVADVEEARYYIMISAYDFPELERSGQRKLLWQTRVSVRSPGNRFDDSVAAMLKSAAKYFGQDSGRLIRGEENKAKVELGDLKFLGEAGAAASTPRPATALEKKKN